MTKPREFAFIARRDAAAANAARAHIQRSNHVSEQGKRPLIRLEAVSKVFHTDEIETHALAAANIEIARGEYVSISGPSGCGKSTLLAILGLLDTPSSGRYELDGVAVHELPPARRARIRNREIGFIFQAFNLIGDMSVYDNVELPLTYRDGEDAVPRAERRRRVTEALEQVGIAHRAGHLPAQLSGGQQQRVAVARALVGKPAILLADEPTGNLDSRNGEAVIELLDGLHRGGATICMVTHDMRHARLAQRGIYLFDGRVVDEETLDRLRRGEEDRIDAQFSRGRESACA
jgi:putative ABC transport system ATP-binding protein